MLYNSAQDWRDAEEKRVLLFGMSGLGKTHVSNLLRDDGGWFHYSIDYRIGTRHMGEHIADNAKRHAMKVPFLRELLMTDSIYIGSNITFNNLAPLSTYLGKPGEPSKGGLSFEEYMTRQEQHRVAEIASLLDTDRFARRSLTLYGYPNFVCDSGGSICEVVDPDDPEDEVLKALEATTLMVWIKGDDAHTEQLVRRFDRAPKPMYYEPTFLRQAWQDYLASNDLLPDAVDPDAFVRWTYARALAHRQPRYAAMAKRGVTVLADEIAAVKTAEDFETLIADALARRVPDIN
ncbi:ATPase [Pseudooceanicola sediminis]|uniref:ATPase n=1 Tax=Pseudooceanicola sediminis TaxID=2211117 RepID=A0A399J595_9RHOB|nr:ATPase [Pseudooceanicola sediminis]KAA2316892.1 ATPase [Puniceibacterium sp. HSS470]RII40653.1 ATPase [Pseudooceanicola sediminis]|tara:strand:+ start:107675 stop:108547 length:873 start_codon:yes stop_codon:yes gene_type:complete